MPLVCPKQKTRLNLLRRDIPAVPLKLRLNKRLSSGSIKPFALTRLHGLPLLRLSISLLNCVRFLHPFGYVPDVRALASVVACLVRNKIYCATSLAYFETNS